MGGAPLRTFPVLKEDGMAEFMNKPMGRRAFVGGALATGVLGVLAGCGQKGGPSTAGSAGGEGASGGTLRYYINNPVSIDPYNLIVFHNN